MATVVGIAIAGDAWTLSIAVEVCHSFDSCFHTLSLYVSLPSEFENITR